MSQNHRNWKGKALVLLLVCATAVVVWNLVPRSPDGAKARNDSDLLGSSSRLSEKAETGHAVDSEEIVTTPAPAVDEMISEPGQPVADSKYDGSSAAEAVVHRGVAGDRASQAGQASAPPNDLDKDVPVAAVETVNEILSDPNVDWQDPVERAKAVARMKAAEERELAKARELAKEEGKPLKEELPDGAFRELVGIDEDTGELLYYETRNRNAAISTGANLINAAPYSLDGAGLLVGVWDGGSVLSTHQEFNEGATSRVNVRDGATSNYHATHVGGTIGAYGLVPNAKGMANQSIIESYNWTSDTSEMTSAAATNLGQHASKVYLSNHSYGYSYGWQSNNGWIWTGTGTDQNAYDADFGQYSSTARSLDLLAINSPYYLIFWAGGNENTDGPNNGQTCTIGGASVAYNSSIHPQNDGSYSGGFDTIGDHGVAKNLITMGAANDAVTSGQRDPSKSTITSFSSTGPADDGRIKPDLVANGASLYSTDNGNDTDYRSLSGTSMSTPNATGSATLLIELYRELFGSSAAMRASTLKGLLIHTASDVGNPGPDYTYGWGLVDVKTAADLLQRQADFPDLESVIEDQLTTAAPVDTYTFSWDGSSPIRATLSWTDPAGSSEGAHNERTPDLVNDLNLKLIAPDGTEYFPFVMPFVGTWTIASMSQNATTGVNNVDNVEQVLVSTPGQSGAWQAVVTYAGSLTSGAQDYGLIISGAGTGGNLVFDPDSYSVSENGGIATISVERVGGSTGACSVDYSTSNGTAIAGSDYTATSGTLAWNDGEGGTKTFNISILNDGVSETYSETVSITLSNASGIPIAGTNPATLTILDDETTIGVTSFNSGGTFVTGSQQSITWVSSLGGNVRIELLKNGINYTTIASSTANNGSYNWTIPQLVPTGSDYSIRITSLAGGGEFDVSDGTFSIENQVSGTIYTADMSSNPGWDLQGQWVYGTPTGAGGQYGNPDPTSGFTGSNVIGYNLAGDYANNLSETFATTQAIDCSSFSNVQLSFRRWLNVEDDQYDNASIRVSHNGTSWVTIWSNSSQITDNSWTQVSYDISAVADGQPTVYIRWVMGSTDGSWQFSGWNIDDVTVTGEGSATNPAGEVAFTSADFQVSEDAVTATITVSRTLGTTGAISVDYSTSNNTATAGSDYTAASGTLTWANGDSSSKSFNVPVADDSVREGLFETVQLTLSNTVGATISGINPATLTIRDDDNNPPEVDAGSDQFAGLQPVTVVPGLYFGAVPGDIDTSTPNPNTQILLDVSSETGSIPGNTTEIFTGSIYDADGQISFTEHIDDKARIWIDGTLVLSNDDWRNRFSTSNLNLTPGWHDIEIRISNGGGGSGSQGAPGIGYDPAGGTNWQELVDPGDGSFLRTEQAIPSAQVTLDGSASDADSDPLTTTWSLVSGPAAVAFADASLLNTTATFTEEGIYTLRLTADDSRDPTTGDMFVTVGTSGLALEIESASIPENGGSSNATVSRPGTLGDLTVNLSSSDTSEATVPNSVTILDGQTSAGFTVTAQDDGLVDGTQIVTITASAAGNPDATDTIDVTDNEVATLTLNIAAASVSESAIAAATTATVTRNSVTTSEMVVNLSSSDTSEVTVPGTVTIATGQTTSPAFAIATVDDSIVDGTQTVTITASFSGHADGTDTLDVTDDPSLTLTVVTGTGGASTTGGGTYDPDAGPFAISATPSTGFDFNNWSVTSGSANVDNVNAVSTFVMGAGNTTVQANFSPATYVISYVGNGSDAGNVPSNQIKTHGQDLTLAVQGDLGRTGYTFTGWNTAANGGGASYPAGGTYAVDAPGTLYAQWGADSYTVTFDANGGDAPSPTTKLVTYDATYGPLATTSRSGYVFLGWFTQASGGTKIESATQVAIAEDHTLHAQWTNALTWDANGTGSGQTNGGGAWLGTNLWWDGLANTNWVSGSSAVFGGVATNGGSVTLASPTTVNSIVVNEHTGTYNLGTAGQLITLNGGISKNADSGTVSIISPIILGGNQTWTNDSLTNLVTSNGTNLVDNGGFHLTIDGTGTVNMGVINNSSPVLTGSGAFSKNGSGRLNVGGVNSGFTGSVTINGGVMQVHNDSEPMGSGNLTLNGGVMSFYWGTTYSRTLGSGDNQVQILGGESGFAGAGTSGPSINLGGTMVWGAPGEGAATGFFNPEKFVLGDEGTGNAAATNFTNGIDLNGVTRTIVVPKGLSSSGNVSTIAGAITSTGPAGLVKEGDGTLVLAAANTYAGDTVISGGKLRIGNNTPGTLTGGDYSGNISIAEGSALQIWSNSAQTLSGTISGAGGLEKAYGGSLTLSGSNTYTGRTSFLPQTTAGCTINITSFNSVNGGTPAMASSSLGAPTTVTDGTIDLGNNGKRASVTLNYTGPGETTDRVINLGFNDTSSQTISASGSGLLKFTSAMTSNAGSQTGKLILSGSGEGEIVQALPSLPTGGLTKSGSGSWTLGGSSSYTSPTNVNAGKLVINGDQSLATGSVNVANTATLGGSGTLGGDVTLAAGGKLEFDLSTDAASHDPLDFITGKGLAFSGTSELTITTSGGATPGIYTLVTGGNNISGIAPSTLNLPLGWSASVSISGNSMLLDVTSTGSGPGPVDHFVIFAIASPQTVGIPITGITITAEDASNETATSFTGTVTFGGTAGITGTSANFVDGVLSGVSVAPANVGTDLTLTVDDGAGHTGSATFTVQTVFAEWSGGTFANPFTDTAPTSNPDSDNLTNLQEFAFGLDPTAPSSGPMAYAPGGDLTSPGVPMMEDADGNPATLGYNAVFARRKDHVMAGLSYTVEFSADMIQWTASSAGFQVVTGAGSAGNLEAVQVPFPANVPLDAGGTGAPQYFRVVVQQN